MRQGRNDILSSSHVEITKVVVDRIFDADFDKVMVSVGFNETPRERYTINDILKFREIEKYK